MSVQTNEELLREIELEKWSKLQKEYGNLLGEYTDSRVNSLLARLKLLAGKHSTDSTIEQHDIVERIDELERLLGYIKLQSDRFDKTKRS